MHIPMNKPRRLFELLVVGGSLWVTGCGPAAVDTGTNTSGANPTVTHSDGGTTTPTGGGEGTGSPFW
jgi:hypothetical protein